MLKINFKKLLAILVILWLRFELNTPSQASPEQKIEEINNDYSGYTLQDMFPGGFQTIEELTNGWTPNHPCEKDLILCNPNLIINSSIFLSINLVNKENEPSYDFCSEQDIEELYPDCNDDYELLEIVTSESYTNIVRTLSTDSSYANFFLSYASSKKQVEEKLLIVRIFSKNSCSSVYYDFSINLPVIPTEIKCNIARGLHTNNFQLAKIPNSKIDIKKDLEELNIIKENGLKVNALNKSLPLFFVFSEQPQKNIILRRNFFETVEIILGIDFQTGEVTMIIDAYYAGGGRRTPSFSDFQSTNIKFQTELLNFSRKFQNELENSVQNKAT